MAEFTKTDEGIFRISGIDPIEIGIAAKDANKIDYSQDFDNIRRDEKGLIKKITGIAEKDILMLDQVHEDSIELIDYPLIEDNLYLASADGMITNQRGLCLVIRTADCVPVFAYDSERNILGAAHSGWKGCRLSISRKLIREMVRVFGAKHSDIRVYILPSIGPSSYEVNNDVASLFNEDISIENNMKYLNLWKNIETSLINEGIFRENIYNSHICTLQNNSDFFSYRNKDTGRNLNFAYINGFRAFEA
ncbi:MAG: peptidoglycan editing factor PgeF [archaeon]|nr:peptidoglycan editing factor PgeF [archaeon]